MAACFEGPQAGWPAAFQEACHTHPEHAEEIRRRLRTVQLMEATRPEGLVQELAFPERLGDFDLIERLGGGGMGIVYRARQRSLSREVALKLIRPEHVFFTGARDRFRREVEAVAQLHHPGIVAIHTVGEELGIPFFAMELLEGRTLAAVLATLAGRAPESLTAADLHRSVTGSDPGPDAPALFRGSWVDACVEICAQVARALHHAHERGILHRDVKPSNVVLLPDGRAILLDFGLTSSAEATDRVTQTGSPVGTLVYMSPEQIEAKTLDGRTDVYSLGVTLYELLTLHVPFRGEGLVRTQNLIVAGGPDSIRARNRRVPPDVEIVCLTAMSARAGDRYAGAEALARDLENAHARRAILARPPGLAKRLVRWTERNPAKAVASVLGLLLVAGLPTVLLVQESLYAGRIDREHKNFLRLSTFHKLADHVALADSLWPIAPERIGAYEDWLRGAEGLRAELDFAIAQREDLRARALPVDTAEAARHPRRAELDALIAKRDALRREQDVREGRAAPVELEIEDPPEEVGRLYGLAWTMVDPTRRVYGREAEALALARRAVELAQDDEELNESAWVLAWSLHSVGLDDDALDAAAMGMETAAVLGADDGRKLAGLEDSVRKARDGRVARQLAEIDAPIARLEQEVAQRFDWNFEKDEDRWWHDQLSKLIGELQSFFDEQHGLVEGLSPEHGWGVERRLALARVIAEETVSGTDARAAWDRAITSIRDVAECPRYGGLEIVPQLGLLPLGRNADTGLWEFLHVPSGKAPHRDTSGALDEPDMGIVLVLLPGGTFWMGAQNRNPEGRNYDPEATSMEWPPHQVSLDPFFISKYELTQRQWELFTGENPSAYNDETYFWLGAGASDLHPVEQVSWRDCARFLFRMGLTMPTEAQWEYAARAGTDTIWWTGQEKESLKGVANLADASALAIGGRIWPAYEEWLDDGQPTHAAAEALLPNPFGLYEIHGNVSEWCRDYYGTYANTVAPGDGERQVSPIDLRVQRDGSYPNTLPTSRSASRRGWSETVAQNWTGVRPARPLQGP